MNQPSTNPPDQQKRRIDEVPAAALSASIRPVQGGPGRARRAPVCCRTRRRVKADRTLRAQARALTRTAPPGGLYAGMRVQNRAADTTTSASILSPAAGSRRLHRTTPLPSEQRLHSEGAFVFIPNATVPVPAHSGHDDVGRGLLPRRLCGDATSTSLSFSRSVIATCTSWA